jgi:UPF0716 protein FxsA
VNKSKLLAYVLAAWLLIEVAAFILVVELFGVMAAVALGLGTTLLGLSDVKRLFVYLRTRASQPRAKGAGNKLVLDGALQALGAALLILPGFASDIVGLALKAPSIRAGLADRLSNKRPRKGPRTIDLAPNEWKTLAQPKRKPADSV